MARPLFGITAGTNDAVSRAQEFGVDFLDLHFGGREELLLPALDACDRAGLRYVLNSEKAPLLWRPSEQARADLARRPGFLGFLLDEADHLQLNAHWPVIEYYGYGGEH